MIVQEGDSEPTLNRAYDALIARAEEICGTFEANFAAKLADWTAHGARADQSFVPIEDALETLIGPLGAQAPVLLLVMDGMSVAVFRELLSDIVQRGNWLECKPTKLTVPSALVATVPSITEISRRALFRGKLHPESIPTEQSGFNSNDRLFSLCGGQSRPVLFLKGDLQTAGEAGLAIPVKQAIRDTPPDILLTTPESLEGMLVSVNPLGRQMLGTARVVVVDEIHAFAGDDRGWHLLAVLERLTRIAGRELQRIGLSATVGNPDALLDWATGHCAGEREVVSPAVTETKSPEVTLDYVGSLENAALVISRLHRGEKRLVFCDSRSRVEELARYLRGHGVETYLSHSSLSIDERRSAEKAFAESRNCVIVSTSTLELGIDVGDLDRVIQIDAPNSVASFLQRLGRTGRRQNSCRNCLFLATSEKALLKGAGLLELWATGFVEPILAPPLPLHIFSQQLMALTLQLKGLGLAEWRQWIGRLPPFAAIDAEQVSQIVQFLRGKGILFEDSGLLGFGAEGEARFGRRHFLEILSVFSTPSMLTAFHGTRELGQVEAGFLLRVQEGNPSRIALGGQSWLVRQIEWRTHRVYVEPSAEHGRGAWIGSGQGLSHYVAGAVKRVLTSNTDSNGA